MLIENVSFPLDRRMKHQALALQQTGYQVSVICPRGTEDRSLTDSFRGIKIYRYPRLHSAKCGLGYLLEYSWAFLCTVILSVLVWVRDGIDIIHSANPPDMFFLLAWPYKILGKKYIFDEHDVCPELYEAKGGRRKWVCRLLLLMQVASYRMADLVISTNQSYREIARQRGAVTDERSAVVRNGVDVAEFHRELPRVELKGDFRYMAAYVGAMGKQDGVDGIIHAAHHAVQTYGRKDVLFVLIGRGDCWLELQELSRKLGVDDVVRFTGYISDELLLDYLSTADVGLSPDLPSRMNQLSTMTKIMEYMACELPIISFDLRETRRSADEAAVYVPRNDPKMFAKALCDLLDDPVRREKMGRIGLERSVNLVGLEYSRRHLLEAYSRLMRVGELAHAETEMEKSA